MRTAVLVRDGHAMCPIDSPVLLPPNTVEALAAVQAWGGAFNERDIDRMLALSAPDIRLADGDRIDQGHDAVRRLLHLQSYGVAQHIRPRRYIARAATVAVEAAVELGWVESGALADTVERVGVFDVRDGRVAQVCLQPDLETAFEVAGWPPAHARSARELPTSQAPQGATRSC
jgi:limonene-1,2-epoxide hydrolase